MVAIITTISSAAFSPTVVGTRSSPDIGGCNCPCPLSVVHFVTVQPSCGGGGGGVSLAVSLTANPTSGVVGNPTSFTATATPYYGYSISYYQFSFGDSNSYTATTSSTTYSVSHSFFAQGSYTVSVVAVDTGGHSGSSALSYYVGQVDKTNTLYKSSSNSPVDDDYYGSGSPRNRSWSDMYLTVGSQYSFTETSTNPNDGSTCVGCWTIQLNAGNSRPVCAWVYISGVLTYKCYEPTTNYLVQYQFVLRVTSGNTLDAKMDLLLPSSYSTTACPSTGWSSTTIGPTTYCLNISASQNAGTNLQGPNTSYKIYPNLDSNGNVLGATYSATYPGGSWSVTINVPATGADGTVLRNPFNAETVNIVGSAPYGSAQFTSSGPSSSPIFLFSFNEENTGYVNGGPGMTYATVETSNLSYAWYYCPCIGSTGGTAGTT